MKKENNMTTWADCTPGSNSVEQREYVASSYHPRPSGKSYYIIRCPFCKADMKAFAWSIRGGGKRCDCGAMLGSGGTAYKKVCE
jgi:hypothetical protein